MTTNKTGRKNKIIGTVSFGGNAAAFFSASDMRMSRLSRARTRNASLIAVPYRSAWIRLVPTALTDGSPVRFPKFS